MFFLQYMKMANSKNHKIIVFTSLIIEQILHRANPANKPEFDEKLIEVLNKDLEKCMGNDIEQAYR